MKSDWIDKIAEEDDKFPKMLNEECLTEESKLQDWVKAIITPLY